MAVEVHWRPMAFPSDAVFVDQSTIYSNGSISSTAWRRYG